MVGRAIITVIQTTAPGAHWYERERRTAKVVRLAFLRNADCEIQRRVMIRRLCRA
jgi:hypothetical protein